jgi:NTE family protein
VDGGLVDNLPVAEVRNLCKADVVIAVNVGSPLLKADQVGSLVTVLSQTINLLTEQNVSRSLAMLKPGDIYIKPDLDGIGATDFDKYAEAADRGRKAAEAVADQLRALAVSEKEYHAWWSGVEFIKPKPPRIDAVEIAKMKDVNPQAVERYIEQRPGEPLDPDKLERDIMRIYGDGFYESVDYSLLSVRDRNILRVTPVEKPWGKDYLRFGLSLDSNSKLSTYNLRAAYHKTWLNSLGGELLAIGQIGSEPGVEAQLYQPLDARQHFFVQPDIQHVRRNVPVFQDNHRLAEYHVVNDRLTLSAGANIGINGQARLGWVGRQKTATLDTGEPVLPEGTNRFDSWTVGFDIDRLNRLYFPTDGWLARLDYYRPLAQDYSKVVGEVRLVEPLGNNYVFHSRFYFVDSPRGTLPFYDAEALGGIQNLSGFVAGQIIGDGIRLGVFRLERIIRQLPLGLRGDVRVGAVVEAGRVNHRYTETNLNGWLSTAGVFIGGETPVGPEYLGYAHSPQGSSIVYIFIGTP